MTPEETKNSIKDAIHAFAEGDLTRNTLQLFKKLGYNTDRQAPMDVPVYASFKEFFIGEKPLNEERAKVSDWKHVDLLFQLTKEEVEQQISLFDTGRVDQTIIEAYLFFAIELSGDSYTRTELSQITREVNRLFPMPVMILFKYRSLLTLSVINRRIHKRDEHKDVLEKVTQIKDISIQTPHRAHLEILFDLSFDELKRRHKVTNFVELHNAWQKTLDTKELNKRFYKELANWYFWAKDMVHFPDDIEKNAEVRNATNLIRLITRLIFIWFIKEKHLVPEPLFDQGYLKKILKSFLTSDNSSDYYNAILQNLFFGTLNQKVEERKFAADGDRTANVKEYGIKNLFRYSGMFAISEAEVVQLFKEIPFLNGGLFDCLDKTRPDGKVEYGDGFSRNPQKMALMPDAIFFGQEKVVDLNPIYGTKNKKYATKGLFNLLASYKFTITENTPIDEEVALDPELLGKTFENLLASYNPETQTTARKQTGSFYTPREIVNYMVDESLIEYLKQAADDKSEAFDAKIRDLFAYNENNNPFTEAETRKLIEALNDCKILDPACGSGAFPMGILHKMVHVLQKLDPANHHWRDLQEQKAIAETRAAYKIGDQDERDMRLTEISDVFENNTSDYGRKLYLIENCIYGVDIQPIAVQISKLRFFISLIIDQKADKGKKNFGIRSLPNLETKFVAANTLIGLEVPTADLFTAHNPIEKLQDALKATRHAYFNARNREVKLKLQEADSRIKNDIAAMISETLLQNRESDIKRLEEQLDISTNELNKLLQRPEDKEIIENTNLLGEVEMTVFHKGSDRIKKLKANIKNIKKQIETLKSSHSTDTIQNVAKQISSFDPYDQNQFAGWFEPEWMFGEDVKKGFDIVIGNPPYGAELKPKEVEHLIKRFPKTTTRLKNSAIYFIIVADHLLTANGINTFIVPKSLSYSQGWGSCANFLLPHLIAFHDTGKSFENVLLEMVVFVKGKWNESDTYKSGVFDQECFHDLGNLEKHVYAKYKVLLTAQSMPEILLLNKILHNSPNVWGDYLKIARGLNWQTRAKKHIGNIPIFRGAQLNKYSLDSPTDYIDISKFPNSEYQYQFKEKILNQLAIAHVKNPYPHFFLQAHLDTGNHLVYETISCSFLKSKKVDIRFLLTVNNSKLFAWLLYKFVYNNAIRSTRYDEQYVSKIPTPDFFFTSQLQFINLADQILSTKQTNPHADTIDLERKIDELVFKLYNLTHEEVKVIVPDFWLSEEEYEAIK